MENDSFDPRSWGKKDKPEPPESAKPPAPPAREQTHLPEMWRDVGDAEAAARREAPTGASQPGGRETTSLPGMWDDVRRETEGAGRPESSAPAKRRVPLLPIALGILLLVLVGAGFAWLTRSDAPLPPGARPAPVQASATPPNPEEVERSFSLANAHEIVPAMVGVGIPEEEALAVTRAALAGMSAQGEIRARLTMVPAQGGAFTVERMQVSYIDGSGAVVTRQGDGSFVGKVIDAKLTDEIKVLNGELDSNSFYTSAVAAGIQDALIPEFINAFAYDFNLASEVEPGDTFAVAYKQQVNAAGEPVGNPELLFASLTTPAKSRQLYRFVGADGKANWYDANGASVKRGLMQTPVDGARLSSTFGMRFHPTLKFVRMHKGIDLAAPVGTAIFAAADGVVVIAGASNSCAGNRTILDHGNGLQTYYFHQSKIMPGIVAGAHVTQGEKIGEIGQSGGCVTGPHLHWEVHVNGEPVDPLTIQTTGKEREKLSGSQLAAFIRQRDLVDTARARQGY